jgi:hypothetical protein
MKPAVIHHEKYIRDQNRDVAACFFLRTARGRLCNPDHDDRRLEALDVLLSEKNYEEIQRLRDKMRPENVGVHPEDEIQWLHEMDDLNEMNIMQMSTEALIGLALGLVSTLETLELKCGLGNFKTLKTLDLQDQPVLSPKGSLGNQFATDIARKDMKEGKEFCV